MAKILRLIFLNILLLSISNFCSAQKLDENKFGAIITFNEVYRSNLIDLGMHTYGDIYLITSKEDINLEMLNLSKNVYNSSYHIINALKTRFNVYTIIRNTAVDSTQNNIILTSLTNSNHYIKGYLFTLSDKQLSSMNNYIILLQNTSNYIFLKVDEKCDPKLNRCTVIVKKIKNSR